MKLIHYIINICIGFSFFFVSCTAEEELPSQKLGYVYLSGIELTNEGELLPATKAVDEKLQIEIWKNGELVPGQSFLPGKVPEVLTLSPGSYILKAFTPEYETEADSGKKGSAAYNKEYEFSLVSGDNLRINLKAPMVNIGVGFNLSSDFSTAFTNYTITVISGLRSYTISPNNKSDICYFNMPASGKLNYTITATNVSGDPFFTQKELSVVNGTIYTINIDIK